MKIATEILQKCEVHESQLNIFSTNWPNGVELSEEWLKEAIELGLNIFWLENLVPEEKFEAYSNLRRALLADYDAKIVDIRTFTGILNNNLFASYEAQVKLIRAVYDDKVKPIHNLNEEQVKSLWREFINQKESSHDVYEAQRDLVYDKFFKRRTSSYKVYTIQVGKLLLKFLN